METEIKLSQEDAKFLSSKIKEFMCFYNDSDFVKKGYYYTCEFCQGKENSDETAVIHNNCLGEKLLQKIDSQLK